MLSTTNSRECYCNRPRRRRGFTLAEILIALGILAIGMSMVAAIFPAAMAMNRFSANSTLGTIICKNGLAMGEMALTGDVIDEHADPQLLNVYADGGETDYLTRAQRHYPVEEENSRTGFVLMARKVENSLAGYQLITIAYRKREATNTVYLKSINCRVRGRNVTVTSGGGNLRIGSPLINRATGTFEYIDSINQNGTAGTLDIKEGRESRLGVSIGPYSCYVLVEKKGNTIIDRRSPAIAVMSKLTGLKSDPGHFGE